MVEPAVVVAVVGLALAPLMPVPYVSERTMVAARDRWLLAGLAIAGVWLAGRGEAWLAVMALWFLCRWRGPSLLPHLTTWAMIAGTWFGALAVVPLARDSLPWVWVAVSVYQIALVVRGRWRGRIRGSYRGIGSVGSHVLTGAMVALAVPFWTLLPWWTWGGLAVGLYLVHSWLSFLAVGAALCVLEPGLIPGVVLLILHGWLFALRGWLTWTPRDNSFDSIRARLNVYPMVWQAWRSGLWRWGAGPDTFMAAGRRWWVRTGKPVPLGEAHNEVLQMAFEYGWLGVACCVLLVVRVAPHLRLEDPWSAAWVVGGVLALGSYPARHVPLGCTWMAITAGVVTR